MELHKYLRVWAGSGSGQITVFVAPSDLKEADRIQKDLFGDVNP